jgi:predicted DsbA family dithiol-disulfide isomerase
LAEPAVEELKRADPGVEIVWKAYELRPAPIAPLDPGGEYLTRVWRDSVYPLAERLGITMRLPPVQPRSRTAHEAAHWARGANRFDDYNAAIFRSFFERGEDISATDILLKLARELQLDESGLRVALEAKEFAASVLADELEAAELGVSGVPAFVADRRLALSGVQTLENLQALAERARALKR